MLLPNLLMWAAAGIAGIWKFSQLARIPHDKNLRVVAVCTGLVFVALTAQMAVSTTQVIPLLPSQSSKLVQNVVLTLFFALLLILLQSAVYSTSKPRRGYAELGLALAVSAALIVIYVVSPAPVRGASYEDAEGRPTILAFYLVGNAYMVYATGRGAFLAWAASGHTRSRARAGLRVAAVGLLINFVGTHWPRVIHTAGQLFVHIELMPRTEIWTTPILAVGIVIFFLGIGYPGVRTGLIKTRYWVETRQRYHQLRPLWLALCQQFPKIALFPPVSALRETFHFRQLQLRYYRRVVECRDGLVYLAGSTDTSVDLSVPAAEQAALVQTMLAREPDTTQRAAVPPVFAAPLVAGMEADTRELLALSRALRRLPALTRGAKDPELDPDSAALA